MQIFLYLLQELSGHIHQSWHNQKAHKHLFKIKSNLESRTSNHIAFKLQLSWNYTIIQTTYRLNLKYILFIYLVI